MDISLALVTLRTATDEALQSRYSEISLTLSILGQRLQVGFLPTTPATIDISTPLSPSDSGRDSPSSTVESITGRPNTYEHNVDSPSPSNRSELSIATVHPTANPTPEKGLWAEKGAEKVKKSTVEKLVFAMKDHICWLWDTIHTDNETISYKRNPNVDIRMDDYRRVEGNTRPSNEDKLLRLLSIRSLAKDFAQETRGNDRLQTITAYVLSIQSGELDPEDSNTSQFKGRCRQVTEFVKLHPSLSSCRDANRAINKGIKHLVFERVLQKKFENLKLPNMSEAMSAVLGLSIDDFKSLTYAQMPQLVDALQSSAFSSPRTEYELRGEKFYLPDVIRRIDAWFTRIQTRYNNVRRMESIPEFERPSAKRACYDNQTGGQQNSPYYSANHQGSNTTQPEPEKQNEVPERLRSENLSLDELNDPFDYTFQGTSYGTQQICTDIETQSVDYTIAYDPAFAELAPCLSAHPFDFSLPPIQSEFDDSGLNFRT